MGRALTWYLDLDKEADKDALLAYAADKMPDDLWTSPDCKAFTTVQRINHEMESDRRVRRLACGRWRTVAIYTESNWDEAGGVTMSSPHKVTLRLMLRIGLGLF